MLNANSIDVEEAWTTIATTLVTTSIAKNTRNINVEQMIPVVKKCLKEKGNIISNILKSTAKCGNIEEIEKNLEDIDNFEKKQFVSLSTTEADAEDYPSKTDSLSTAQLSELRKRWPIFRNIEWDSSLFQDYLIQDGVLSEDGRRSIADKNSEKEQHWAIFHFVLSLSATDIFSKILPILETLGYDDIARMLKDVQRIKENDQRLSFSDIRNLINPRRLADVLYKNKAIKELMYNDLISPFVPVWQKMQILQSLEWDHFFEALKETYPHMSAICPKTRPKEDGQVKTKSISLTNLSDIARLSDLSDFSDPGYKQGTRRTVRYKQLPWCPKWCSCGKCRRMDDKRDQICCTQRRGTDCLAHGKEVEAIIAVAHHLMGNQRSLMKNVSDLHRKVRQVLYRQVSLLTHGRTGPGQRQRIPSCCIWKIRGSFPDPKEQYTGFRESHIQIMCSNTRPTVMEQKTNGHIGKWGQYKK